MKLSKSYLIKDYSRNKKPIKQIKKEKNCGITTIYRTLKYYDILTNRNFPRKDEGNKGICIDCGCSISKYYAKRCRSCSKKGKLHGHWKNGKRIRGDGYILIYSPNHPYKTTECYVFEHRLVMEAHLNKVSIGKWIKYGLKGNYPKNIRFLTRKEIIHHINGIKNDNKIKNLILFPNKRGHHLFIHLNKKTFICKFCNKDQRKVNKTSK